MKITSIATNLIIILSFYNLQGMSNLQVRLTTAITGIGLSATGYNFFKDDIKYHLNKKNSTNYYYEDKSKYPYIITPILIATGTAATYFLCKSRTPQGLYSRALNNMNLFDRNILSITQKAENHAEFSTKIQEYYVNYALPHVTFFRNLLNEKEKMVTTATYLEKALKSPHSSSLIRENSAQELVHLEKSIEQIDYALRELKKDRSFSKELKRESLQKQADAARDNADANTANAVANWVNALKRGK